MSKKQQTPFSNQTKSKDLSVKLWRGERMCLIGMDVDAPEDDFVGFSIEVKSPGSDGFMPLRNRLNFDYKKAGTKAVDGNRNYPSTEAPFQKFRWVHFPYEPKDGTYQYRVTKLHMPKSGKLQRGSQATLDISLSAETYDDYLDIGFTRNYASSQAYNDLFGAPKNVIPESANDGLDFKKLDPKIYQWLGFGAYELIFGILNEVENNKNLSLDVLAYDLNERDIVEALEKCGKRLRIVIDDSRDHKAENTAESQAAVRLAKTAGADNVRRMHFKGLQHNKVLIVKEGGKPVKVLFGSTNFSFRGLYIQSNNALVFKSPDVAALFETVFTFALQNGAGFTDDPISTKWHLVQAPGKPNAHFTFAPHTSTDLSLNPIGGAIDQASSSVFFALAFLGQTKTGAPLEAIDRLENKGIFSYGIVDRDGQLNVHKPDGSIGIVDFAYLSANAPEPFKAEWAAGTGPAMIHEHDKFVVTDFNLPTAKVFTGSSNQSVSGENKNGDNLVMIEDQRVATAYAIEALRLFDHLHFRVAMKDAKNPHSLTLWQPGQSDHRDPWFKRFFASGSQEEKDRMLFST